MLQFTSGKIESSVSGVHLDSLDAFIVVRDFFGRRMDKSVVRFFEWILFFFCSYFIQAVKERFFAVIVLGGLDFGKLSDGDNLRVGDEDSFVDGLGFEGFFVDISFDAMREIVFL